MATQLLEFNCTSGLTLAAKLFAIGSDTIAQTASSVVEKTNNKNRYVATFTDVPAGAYSLNAFVGATGGYANEVYDLSLASLTFVPRGEIQNSSGIVRGVADTGSTTTSIVIKSIDVSAISVNDQLKGRIVIFDKNTLTANLRGQGAPIANNTTAAITIAAGNALTTAPVVDDTFTVY